PLSNAAPPKPTQPTPRAGVLFVRVIRARMRVHRASTMSAAKQRLDALLVTRALVPTRAKAKTYIIADLVRSGNVSIDKTGKEFPADLTVTLAEASRFVSRGGEKRQGWLDRFGLDLRGAHLLDVGASTGGFTDCALLAGAAS